MTMVHITTTPISRKEGRSAVACAAYRAGVTLEDNRYEKTHDYSKKRGVMSADIILPSTLKAQDFTVSRSELWNKAEQAENRKDARVAREWLINLPYELNEDDRKAVAHEFAQALADKYNIIADVCIHQPVLKEPYDPKKPPSFNRLREDEQNPDPRNYHAHIMVTTREAKIDDEGGLSFDPKLKIPLEWSNAKRKAKKLQPSRDEIKEIRQLWVDIANKKLSEHDLGLMDARSFKDQGLDRLPTIKMGVDATNMERKGINTYKGNINRAISVINKRKEINKARSEYEQEIREQLEWANKRTEWTNYSLEWADYEIRWAAGSIGDIERRVRDSKQGIEDRKRNTAWQMGKLDRAINYSKQGIDDRKRNVAWTDNSNTAVHGAINSTAQRTTNITEQERSVNRLIAERTAAKRPTRPNPFDDAARRARADRIIEQEGRFDRRKEQFDRETDRKNWADERAALAAGRIKIAMAMVLLSRHTGMALQSWESIEDYPEKLDARQIKRLDDFAQMIGADDKITDFSNDSIRVSKLFTADVIEQNIEIFKLLRNPAKEREQYNNSNSKTSLSALQNDLNEFTRGYVDNEPNSSNRANESVSIASKQRRRP